MQTREEWLTEAVRLLVPIFAEKGWTVPVDKVKVSCGIPSGKKYGKILGQCWADRCSDAGHHEIFICPILSKSFEVLDTLVHEVVHATVGVKEGHKGKFRACCLDIGMKGPMRYADAGPVLAERLNALIQNSLGKYPHAKLKSLTGPKKQGTRMIKLVCPECEYTIRTTHKWIEVGMPICCCGTSFEQ